MREGTILQLATRPKDLPAHLRLRNVEWGLLFAIDGVTPLGQLRRAFNLTETEVGEIARSLAEKGLVREREVSLTEYMAAQTAGAGKQPQTLLELLQGGTVIRALTMEVPKAAPPTTHQPPAQTAPAAAPGPAPTPGTPRMTPPLPISVLAAQDRPQTASAPVVPVAATPSSMGRAPSLTPFAPLPQVPVEPVLAAATATDSARPLSAPAPSHAPMPDANHAPHPAASSDAGANPTSRRRLSMKGVIDYILGRAPDVNAGQLDVYRVFIRINTRLLKRNGIHSLRFEEDRVITDAELQEAILTSVEKTLGNPCPDKVFV